MEKELNLNELGLVELNKDEMQVADGEFLGTALLVGKAAVTWGYRGYLGYKAYKGISSGGAYGWSKVGSAANSAFGRGSFRRKLLTNVTLELTGFISDNCYRA